MQKVNRKFCSISKRIATGFLATLLSFLIVIGSAYKNPVKAEAAATAGGIAIGMLVAAAAAAVGVGVNALTNNESYQQSCEQIGNEVQRKIAADGKKLSDLVTVGANNALTMSKEFLFDVAQVGAKFFPPVEYKISSSADIEKMAGLKHFDVPSSGMCWRNAFTGSFEPWKMMTKAKVIASWVVPAVTSSDEKDVYSLKHCKIEHLDILDLKMSLEDNGKQSGCFDNFSKVESLFPRFDNSYLIAGSKFIEIAGLDSAGVQCLLYLSNMDLPTAPGICVYPKTAVPLPLPWVDVFDPADKAFFAEGYSAMIHSFADVVARIGAIQGVIDGIRVKVTDWTYPAIRTLTQTTILEKDITTEKDTDADDTRNKGRSTTVPKNPDIPNVSIPKMVFRKFPFCLPIDFVRGVKMMQAPPKPPVFDVPVLVVPQLHWNYRVQLDIRQFDKNDTLVGIVRWAVGILWSFGLVFITKKLIWK